MIHCGTPDRRPWVIAHRGASADRPENTFEAFDEALRQGACGIELDVQLSRDGVPMVHHDRTLVRAGAGRRRVHRLDQAELRPHIPSLEDVLDRYGDRTRLLVEVKTREGAAAQERHLQLARTVAELIRDKLLIQNTMLLSFDSDVLAAVAECAADLPRVLNLRPPPLLTRAFARRLPSWQALSADVRMLTPSFARALRQTGCPLMVFPCNSARRVRKAVDAGAMAVISARPGWLAEQLKPSEA